MHCRHRHSKKTSERPERTKQGYRRFRCLTCGRGFNERTGTALNRAQYPSDVISLVVLWRLRYRLTLRDLAEMFVIRGIAFAHEAVREWEAKLASALADELRRCRRGRAGRSWYVDETCIEVRGRRCHLYRAVGRDGDLADIYLGEARDLVAAQAFSRSAKSVTDMEPDRVTTDGHDAYPGAIRAELGGAVAHRASRYLNNHLEQDHRGVKGRCRPMRGFKSVPSARRFCRAYDEARHFLRPPSPPGLTHVISSLEAVLKREISACRRRRYRG